MCVRGTNSGASVRRPTKFNKCDCFSNLFASQARTMSEAKHSPSNGVVVTPSVRTVDTAT